MRSGYLHDTDPVSRACSAWDRQRVEHDHADRHLSARQVLAGLEYVTVRSGSGQLLAVYRIRAIDRVLRRMKRPPRPLR